MSSPETSIISGRVPPSGAGGWLLFLIITMVFIGPLSWIQTVPHSYHRIGAIVAAPHSYSHYVFFALEQLLGLALYAYGLFAGILLWKTRPRAAAHAKRFLLLYAAYHLADFAMGANFALVLGPDGTLRKYLSIMLPNVGRSLGYPAIWYAYLLKSKRVRNTFSPQASHPNDLSLVNRISE